MNGTDFERPPAETIRELDLHLRYVQGQLAKLVGAMPDMATKQDIENLARRMEGYATKEELRAVADRVQTGSIQSTFDRGLSLVTRLGAAGAVIVAFFGALMVVARLLDKIQLIK